jgi:hypothetical protein
MKHYRVTTRRTPTSRPATKEKILNDIAPQLVRVSKHAKATRSKCEPVGTPKPKNGEGK